VRSGTDLTSELQRVANLDHRDEPTADVFVRERQHIVLAAGDVRRPCPGEAVGLLLFEDRRLVELVGPRLHSMAELVGQHHRNGTLAELV
jgi:hypothetical protein